MTKFLRTRQCSLANDGRHRVKNSLNAIKMLRAIVVNDGVCRQHQMISQHVA